MRLAATCLVLVAACAHTDGIVETDSPPANGPFADGPVIRLTYDPGIDLFPSVTSAGVLAYSYQPTERPDRDRCIGILPAGGGTRIGFCHDAVDGDGLTDALEWPALDASGALLYGHYVSGIGDRIPDRGALRLGSADAPLSGRVLLTLPNTVASTGFTRIGQTEWSAPGRFVFVAQDYLMLGNIANGNKKDTTYVGLALIAGEVGASAATFTVIPGADSAATFMVSPMRDAIYFTRHQDTRLYRIPIAGGTPEVIFAATVPGQGWVLRNPTQVGSRIAAVVARLDQDAQPRGLLAGTRVELIDASAGTSELLFQPAAGTGVGAIVGIPGSCRIVLELRRAANVSWTTDLESRCAGTGAGCAC